MDAETRAMLDKGVVIPASPLVLNRNRKLDVRRQRALWRYYLAAGAGGIAVGVHTTQFAIRDPHIGLFEPLLSLAREEFDWAEGNGRRTVRIGGVIGPTPQAVGEAGLLRDNGFHIGLLGLGALHKASDDALIAHCRAVSDIIPVMGFYLQPAAGGRLLPYSFWRRFAEIENVVAIKIAPFNRYQTLDVVRAVADAGRVDIALYTGNDDNILPDLLTPFCFQIGGGQCERRLVGGLLGHWAVWTRRAVEQLNLCHRLCDIGSDRQDCEKAGAALGELLRLGVSVTDANAALFDAANGFAGCIAGLHEVLRRQGMLEGIWLLDEQEGLSPGQMEEIDRVYRAYPYLNDDSFVAEHRDEWMRE